LFFVVKRAIKDCFLKKCQKGNSSNIFSDQKEHIPEIEKNCFRIFAQNWLKLPQK
jgi:hypothetical protein